MVAYIVLYAFNDKIPANSTTFDTNVTSLPGLTASASLDEFYYCGANDCQDVDVVTENIDQYVPTNQITIYILIGILAAMCVLTQIIHISLLPDLGSYVKRQKKAVDGQLDERTRKTNNEQQDKQRSFDREIEVRIELENFMNT